MTRVVTTAPGKVVLLGEYAVLDGAQALAMAINRRARVTAESCAVSECEVRVPQLGIDPVRFRFGARGRFAWDCSAQDWERFARTGWLFERLLARIVTQGSELPPFRATIETGALFTASDSEPVKLGLGSSAAVAVALDATITAFSGNTEELEAPASVFGRLLGAYRQGQRGYGSGIDLATSLHGGVISFKLRGQDMDVHPHALPEELQLLFVWTGMSASTTDLVSAYRNWCSSHTRQARELMNAMSEVCQAGSAAIAANDAGSLIEQIGAYGQIMGTMNQLTGLPVMTDTHRLAMAHAERLGVAYKPCGAGGGDLGVAVATDPGVIDRLAKALAQAGLQHLDLAVDDTGVAVRRQP